MSADEFTPYDTSHLGAVAVMALGIVALLVAARRLDDPGDRLGKALAIAILATTLPLQALYFTAGYWNPQTTLPVQLCDLASLAAVYALWTHRWWATALTYYWGITLTSQAVITPDLATPFPDPVFLLFWAMHIGTIWAAVHLTWGRHVRPSWRGYRFAVVTTAVWAVAVFCLNVAAGTNYGYLNAKPSKPSVLDLLGPWPWYVAAEVVIILAVWALLTWPWERRVRPVERERVGTAGR
ncbi:TIGR02206 family membrane protein [Nocardioides gansuensis]|uniref:TIGR02206 family membrane protein n=1 Tax=Nocardioides gansuensis TaxID=2138300 RepID=A0A2T8F7V0_9ACTN|nr:TIGR02206 family membrane protein [Nocardioides gansuensis]PVG81780.1 TIGR02206 family membrane protein [Nocardioides gansuensis]